MGFPVAQVADLALCLAFNICTVNNGYQQRVKMCANGVTVSPGQKCPKVEQQQQTVVAGASPPVVQQVQQATVTEAATDPAEVAEMASDDE